ncbi:PadR family transcriptional regulator [Kibdelosporangium philippinense]|uniref:PadR family transcriptional regulator n=1 Tax=Kibdelosporangium philippinense TaxID=211113 RepID=A0ABS8ZUQ7_9PSEU|nr:PadR family transcriptional regulator [Kibdelosporangium philippinense]MCE7011436.1 PadR family transcriptional regulator [Kibdelosporangium philippinense]
MALRHALLAALLDRELSGYQLSKLFDLGASSFWHASSQQLYAELAKLEADGLLTGHEVVQQGRPNKRVFVLTDEGRHELARFTSAPTKPTSIRDDLMVKAYAEQAADPGTLIKQLTDRAAQSRAKAEFLGSQLEKLRGDKTETDYLASADNVGAYLACTRGKMYHEDQAEWCEWAAEILRSRS